MRLAKLGETLQASVKPVPEQPIPTVGSGLEKKGKPSSAFGSILQFAPGLCRLTAGGGPGCQSAGAAVESFCSFSFEDCMHVLSMCLQPEQEDEHVVTPGVHR